MAVVYCSGSARSLENVFQLRRAQNLRFISKKIWCGRPDSNRHSSFEPRDFHTNYGFRRLASAFSRMPACLWSGLYLHPGAFALGAARLVSTPSLKPSGPERLARDCQLKGFPEFGQFYSSGFPEGTQMLKSLASTISPRPLWSPDQILSAFP